MDPFEVVMRFVGRINAHDVSAMSLLMTEDHVMVDSLGRRFSGLDALIDGWNGYFGWMPDYRIVVERSLTDRDFVVLIGTATGTFAPDGRYLRDNGWQIPACWTARVVDEKVAEWRIYADNAPILAIMDRNKR